MNFQQFPLQPEILQAIQEMKYAEPTEIQKQTLPILLDEPTDFIGLAATGTGKTAAFAIPLLQKIEPDQNHVQALILCPTRELALQVKEQVEMLGRHKKVKVVTVYGGTGYAEQIRGLRSGAQVVVGTPGRIIDHLDRKTLNLQDLKTLVLDEADEMISMGFREDIERVLQASPSKDISLWLFSATMDKSVAAITKKYLKNPKQIQINKKEVLSDKMEQFYYMVRESDKPEIVCKLIDGSAGFYGIIFCQTKQLVTDLTTYLIEKGYKADCLHGDKDQNSRERTMNSFRQRKIQILVCTDVASRGLDVKDITHVINYSLPRELENYVHRIGRTARSGKAGIALNLVSPVHRYLIKKLEEITKSRMLEGKLPSRKEIGYKKVLQLLPEFQNQTASEKARELLSPEWLESLSTLSSEEVAARFLTLMMPNLFIDRPQRFQQEFKKENEGQQQGRSRRDHSGTGSRENPRGDSYRRSSERFSSARAKKSRHPSRQTSQRKAHSPWG